MTPNYYKSLRVAPGAEAAEIRAAYRALMRLYHPDRNSDPQAQARAQEITAAFAVLGNPEKRAAYDAPRMLATTSDQQPGFVADLRRNAPMRNFGLASVAVAMAVVLAFAFWPASEPLQRQQPQQPQQPQQRHITAVRPGPIKIVARESLFASSGSSALEVDDVAPVPQVPDRQSLPLPAVARAVTPASPNSHPSVHPTRELAQVKPAPMPVAAEATPAVAPASLPAPVCRHGSPKPDGGCSDNREAQVERIATGFFKQSMDHADSSKQQLLLSARDRFASSRAQCHSDECVTDAYLRQMRDTTAIMMGRAPNQ